MGADSCGPRNLVVDGVQLSLCADALLTEGHPEFLPPSVVSTDATVDIH